MLITKRSLLFFTILLLAGCAGYLPGVGILAPSTLGGYEMDASGLKGSYDYRFAEDGTYQRETTLPSGLKSKPVSGTWEWTRLSTSQAVLTLDKELVVELKFTTHEHANAKLVDDERLYPVEFTAPESE